MSCPLAMRLPCPLSIKIGGYSLLFPHPQRAAPFVYDLLHGWVPMEPGTRWLSITKPGVPSMSMKRASMA